MSVWWLSFVDANDRFLGVSIVEVAGVGDVGRAAIVAAMTGCNPGGQVWGAPIPAAAVRELALPRHRLLTEEEVVAVGAEKLGDAYDQGLTTPRNEAPNTREQK